MATPPRSFSDSRPCRGRSFICSPPAPTASRTRPAPTAVPDLETTLNSFQLFGRYRVNKNVLLRFNYAYEKYRTSDWAFDNATPISSNNVLLTGHQAPNYTANVFGVSVAYTGW